MERIAGRVCIIIISLFLFGFFSMTKMNEKIFITVRVAIIRDNNSNQKKKKKKTKIKKPRAKMVLPSPFSSLHLYSLYSPLFCLF